MPLPTGKKADRCSKIFSSVTEASSTQTSSRPNAKDGLSRGDARGAAVLLEGVSVARGSAQILENINLRVEPRSKWAVIGTNGAGLVLSMDVDVSRQLVHPIHH